MLSNAYRIPSSFVGIRAGAPEVRPHHITAMPYLPLRSLPPRPSQALTSAWLERLADRLAACTGDVAAERAVVCRETLAELAYPEYAANWETAVADESVPLGTRLALAALDPRNVTLEPEYYADCDDARFQPVKPLLWLWYSFDRLPLGGQNVELGRAASTAARAVHLQAVRRELQGVPARRVLVRLQHRGRRRRRRAPARAARRPRRDPARQQGLDQRLREHLQPHAQHRRAARRDECADGARGRRAHHVPRDGAGRRARGRAGDGGRDGGGDEGRAAVPRVRRDPGEERAREAERAGAGDDPAHGGAAVVAADA